MNVATTEGVYLRSFLSPLAEYLDRENVTDLYVNRPHELWIETIGGKAERHEVSALTEATLLRLSCQIAALSHQGISREHPLLSATLPDGARVQIIAPPATRAGIVLAIRKHIAADLCLADYIVQGAFENTRVAKDQTEGIDRHLAEMLEGGEIASALSAAVRARKNILISGGTASGKTTFLNALMREIQSDERLILIEDTSELQLRHANSIGLIAARSELGEALVTASDLVAASLRLRPDRIILGELRGDEAFAFLRAINTGHPGSMTTIHGDSPESAIEQLVLLVLQQGSRLRREDVADYVRRAVGIYVQLERTTGKPAVKQILLS